MTIVLNIAIDGQPVAKGRPRARVNGRIAVMYTPKPTVEWERSAGYQMIAGAHEMGVDGVPLRLDVVAVGKRPQRLMRQKDHFGRIYRMAKPDGDNVLKIVADALQKCGVVKDDKSIVEWSISSVYAAKDEDPCVEVVLTKLGTLF